MTSVAQGANYGWFEMGRSEWISELLAECVYFVCRAVAGRKAPKTSHRHKVCTESGQPSESHFIILCSLSLVRLTHTMLHDVFRTLTSVYKPWTNSTSYLSPVRSSIRMPKLSPRWKRCILTFLTRVFADVGGKRRVCLCTGYREQAALCIYNNAK